MIDIQAQPETHVQRRRQWLLPLVAVAVVAAAAGAGFALASRDDTPAPASAAAGQLVDISQACTTWMHNDARWASNAPTWCQDMTGWMNQQMANGSMMGSMMWGDPDQMLTTCRAWMNVQEVSQLPAGWCDEMMRGMWPNMSGDWDRWDDWMGGSMMGG